LGLQQTSDRIVADAQAITVRRSFCSRSAIGSSDDRPQHAFFDRLGSATKEKHALQGFYHDTLGERDRAIALARVRRFLLALFERAPERVDLTGADRLGFTRDEADVAARAALPEFAAGPLLARNARDVALRRDVRRRSSGRARERIRFGQHARLRLSERCIRPYAGGTPDRSSLSRLGGMARHPAAQAPRRGTAREAISRLRSNARPVHIVDVAAGHGATFSMPSQRAPRAPIRSSCATTARSTCAMGPR
jgi:hypothetical protein